ncbi:MAG: right-handed parallel beta-helix repeat-containing protein [Clostridia bacterium]|nr:right-handed parallel beta-helix repeat-containing protein [Clostridia bacterium]
MLKKIVLLFLAAVLTASVCSCGSGENDGPEDSKTVEEINEVDMSGTIVNTEFADGIIPSVDELGISLDDYIRGGGKGDFSYAGNRGCKELSVIKSPQYTLTVNETEVPVYSTIVHDGTFQKNILCSFAIVEIKDAKDVSLKAELTPQGFKLKNATVLPAAKEVAHAVTGGKVIMAIKEYGNFSVLVADGKKQDYSSDFSREHSFTLFVREYVDEDAEIAALIERFGEDNVTVYEPGLHKFQYINIDSDDRALYFRRGCYMFSEGREDYSEDNNYFEKHRGDDITWNLNRFPVINANGRKNIVIAGGGWIDGGGLGWHERRGVLLSYCDGIDVHGITLFNMPEWSFITYVSQNIDVRDCRIYGFKSNSDGFAICNSKNATVTDCFARSGDDLFEIKTLGGPDYAVADNVTFTSCTAWASKARCFGIIAETEKAVTNITFRDCYVIYRDSTWDNEFLGSLMVYCEKSKNPVNIDNILFENVEIFCDRGRAINVKIEDEKAAPTHVTNVRFKNITYTSAMKNQLYSPAGDYVQNITLENVAANGKLIAPGDDFTNYFDITGEGNVSAVK